MHNDHSINAFASGKCGGNLNIKSSNKWCGLSREINIMGVFIQFHSGVCHRTYLIGQCWLRLKFGAFRQHTIAWTNVDPNQCRQMASFGHNELKSVFCFTLDNDLHPPIYVDDHNRTVNTPWIFIYILCHEAACIIGCLSGWGDKNVCYLKRPYHTHISL